MLSCEVEEGVPVSGIEQLYHGVVDKCCYRFLSRIELVAPAV
jgi:hypothetical protein